ncbi:MAG: AI-2E family transporter [Candidatus Saccharibacteria bacterium]|nr:AI-2E family transporter [Candidatus Saccharibacteria bacterium]
MSKIIETDTKTFIRFWLVPLGIGLVLLFLYMAASGLIIIGLSIFLAIALKPLVRTVNNFFIKHFGKQKGHQTTSAVLAYLIVVLVIGGILAIVGPVVVNETARFIQHFPETFESTFGGWDGINNFGKLIGIDDLHNEISNAITGLSNNLLTMLGNNLVSSVSGVANIVMKAVLILVLTLLFMLEGPSLAESFWNNVSAGEENKKPVVVAKRVVARMANVISTYVSRQVIVAAIDGLASGLIVFCLSLFTPVSPSIAVPMGMITMLFYLIPMFGQFIGGMLVTVILFFSSPLAAIIFATVYIIYAQIENNVIAPKIQGGALNLPAVAILSSIVIGMFMFGLIGAIVSVPIAGCTRVLIDEYPNIKSARKG